MISQRDTGLRTWRPTVLDHRASSTSCCCRFRSYVRLRCRWLLPNDTHIHTLEQNETQTPFLAININLLCHAAPLRKIFCYIGPTLSNYTFFVFERCRINNSSLMFSLACNNDCNNVKFKCFKDRKLTRSSFYNRPFSFVGLWSRRLNNFQYCSLTS